MSMKINKKVIFIIYVEDQERSKAFYQGVLNSEPTLHVPGMTEFDLTDQVALGIMPGDGIVKILEEKVENPNQNNLLPRCELYLFVDDPDCEYEKVIKLGGEGIDRGRLRNWGDYVSYCRDFDGNILAFAKKEICSADERR